MSEQEFKILDGVRRCASTGELIDGKQVLRPLRFFVSETSQHITLASFAGLMQISESQDSALKIVAALRPLVESRLEELKKDKATQVACSDWCVCLYCVLLFSRSPGDPPRRRLRH